MRTTRFSIALLSLRWMFSMLRWIPSKKALHWTVNAILVNWFKSCKFFYIILGPTLHIIRFVAFHFLSLFLNMHNFVHFAFSCWRSMSTFSLSFSIPVSQTTSFRNWCSKIGKRISFNIPPNTSLWFSAFSGRPRLLHSSFDHVTP